MTSPDPTVSRPQISVCAFIWSETLIDPIIQVLKQHRYAIVLVRDSDAFFDAIHQPSRPIDCLILERHPDLNPVVRRLHREAFFLPAVLLTEEAADGDKAIAGSPLSSAVLETICYHTAEVSLFQAERLNLPHAINSAISRFLKLSQARLSRYLSAEHKLDPSDLPENLLTEQERLSEKLKERLGYIGIYYKRDSQLFFRNLPPEEREEFLAEVTAEYRDIILGYFRKNNDINRQIDDFVNKIFFADMSISQVLEIHMELMDRLAKKLKLEGRNEDILLDYRLTLIDVIAHLCEMYRRSIPRDP